jgi:hypothetical protein
MSSSGNQYYKKIDTISGQMSNINVSNGVAVSLTTHSLNAYSGFFNNLTVTNLTTTNPITCEDGIHFPGIESEDATISLISNALVITSTNEVDGLVISDAGVTTCTFPQFDQISTFTPEEGNENTNFTSGMCTLFVFSDPSPVTVYLPQVSTLLANRICTVKRIGANDVTINVSDAGTTMDDSSDDIVLSSDYSFSRFIGYGENSTWYTC